MVRFNSAPDMKKKSIKIGGVNLSIKSNTLLLTFDKLTYTALIAIHANNGEYPNALHTLIHNNIIAVDTTNLFPLPVNHFVAKAKATPSTANTSAPTISMVGLVMC